jgi:hypothetical protein
MCRSPSNGVVVVVNHVPLGRDFEARLRIATVGGSREMRLREVIEERASRESLLAAAALQMLHFERIAALNNTRSRVASLVAAELARDSAQ